MNDAGEQPQWLHYRRAEELINIERWREALHELFQFLRGAPDNYSAMCLLGQCYFRLREYNNALEWAARAVQVDPNNEWAHRLQAIVLQQQGNRRQALRAAKEAVRIAPDEPFALHILASTQLDWDLVKDAEQTAIHLREQAPESILAHTVLGRIEIKRKRWRLAEAHYRRALQIEPTSWEAMTNLGLTLLKQSHQGLHFKLRKQKLMEAKDFFKRAIATNPLEEIAKMNLQAAERSSYIFGSFSLSNFSGRAWIWIIIALLIYSRAAFFAVAALVGIFFALPVFGQIILVLAFVGIAFLLYKLRLGYTK